MTLTGLRPAPAAPPAPVHPGFRPDVQALRALAVLLVVASHLLGVPRGGFVGVDVFFVLSGFLITGLLLGEGERTGLISLREFYARRVRRIVPLALVVLVSTVAVARVVLPGSRADATAVDALWAGGFLANVRFSTVGTDYFAQGLPPSPLQHYWSLAVEEQFYVVWPLAVLLVVLAAARRTGASPRLLVGALAALLSLVSFAWCLHLTSTAPTEAFFSTPVRAWELGVGALLAAAAPLLRRLPDAVRAGAGWTGLAAIGAGALLIGPDTPFPGTAALLPVLGTVAVLAGGDVRGGIGSTRLVHARPVQWTGLVSYSLYLWHWPCLVLAAAWFGASGATYYAVAGLLPFLLAAVSYALVEDPVRRSSWLSARPPGQPRRTPARWHRDNRRTLDGLLVLGAATAVLVAGVADLTDRPEPQRAVLAAAPTAPDAPAPTGHAALVAEALSATEWTTVEPSLDDLPGQVAPEWRPDGCLNVLPAQADRCVYGQGPRTAVLLGDSTAVSWAPAVRTALEGSGHRVHLLTLGECPAPLLPTWRNDDTRGEVFAGCEQHRRWVHERVRALQPDLVVLSSSPGFAGRVVGVPITEAQAAWQRGTEAALQQVMPHAGRTVVLGAPPRSGNLQTCVTGRSGPAACVQPLSPAWSAVAAAEAAAARAAGAVHVDPSPWFCHDGRCPAVVDGTPVLWDGSHLTAPYARRLGPLLRPVLLGAG